MSSIRKPKYESHYNSLVSHFSPSCLDRIYPAELQLNKTNSSDTKTPFSEINLSVGNGTISTKIYDKRNNFDFDIINSLFLDGGVPRLTSYRVYISQLIHFAKASSKS